MPSPFPGMDPFLEGHGLWREFHNAFIVAAQEQILERLPPAYDCRLEVELFLRERSAEERLPVGRADWAVRDRTPGDATNGEAGGSLATLPTMRSSFPPAVDEETYNLLHLVDSDGERLICVVELLSPSNKSGSDRAAYVTKRRRIERGGAALVELDLLRDGRRMPLADPVEEPFVALVSRPEERPSVDLWTFGLRDPLPTIPIPLSGGDPPVPLDLAVTFTRTFDRGAYARRAYRRPPEPPLDGADAAWAADLLTAAAIPLPPNFPPAGPTEADAADA